MFGILRPKKAEVLSHWYVLLPNFNASTKDFYGAIEDELKEREVPGLEMRRVEFSEGGLTSDRRQYLRMTRERFVFDVCSAPFGRAHFFSCRFAEIPIVVKVWQLVVLAVALYFIMATTWKVAGFVSGTLLLLAAFVLAIYLLRNAVALGLRDLDAQLIRSPVIGPVYERFFRKETYFRQDTRLMYLETVNEVVKVKVEEATGAKGIKLLRFNEHDPILAELYKPRIVKLEDAADQPEPEPCLASTVS